VGKDRALVLEGSQFVEPYLGLRDFCYIFGFRLWNLYFYSEGLELEDLQAEIGSVCERFIGQIH